MITYLEPDILECEVKWALGSIITNKASGGDGITVELFQILKDDAMKVLHSICQQNWKTQQWPQDWKRSVFIPIPKKSENWKWSHSVVSDSLLPHELWPTRLLHPWNFPGMCTGVGCHFLLQRLFSTQGLNLGLLHCRRMLYHLSDQGILIPKKGNAKEC